MVSALHDPAENVAQLRLVIDQLQQGCATCTSRADSEDIFGGWIQAQDQQAGIQQDDAGIQAVENLLRIVVESAVVARAARPLRWCYRLIRFCCT
jgi:hypothetical protein